MRIDDDVLIYNFKKLYNKKIIIYGAGEYGRRTAAILNRISKIQVASFCVSDISDGGKENGDIGGLSVKSIEDVCREYDVGDILFVVSANAQNTSQIIDVLDNWYNDMEVEAVTFTGLYLGVYFNLGKKLFSEEFEKWFQIRNELGTVGMRVSVQYESALRIFEPDNVWVYQPAKVGSTSVCKGLECCGIPYAHIHRIHTYSQDDYYYLPHVREYFKLYEGDFESHRGKKIISIVRDPISRSISQIFQWIASDFIVECDGWRKAAGEDLLSTCLNQISNDMQTGRFGYVFSWFDNEIKPVFGIDIYKFPFDREAGYGVVKQDGVEILLLTMEKMAGNEKIIGDFVGCKDFKIRHDNAGIKKHYRYLYEKTKRELSIPDDVLEFYYDENLGMKHFYNENDIDYFRGKYVK